MNRLSNSLKSFYTRNKNYKYFSKAAFVNSNVDNDNNSSEKKTCKLEAAELDSRSLLVISGVDSQQFLQGLITNDIKHLETKPSIYTLFLNQQGRVLFDAILYNSKAGAETLVECDKSVKNKLAKHLMLFRVRKKVTISDVNLKLWVVFDPAHKYVVHTPNNDTIENINQNHSFDSKKDLNSHERVLEEEICCSPIVNHSSKREDLPLDNGLEAIGDPRLSELGWRVLVPENVQFPRSDIIKTNECNYRELRYSLGVGEGVNDLPSGNCFPLESNGDYLHGISFHKGCYIGQELTARTHHTGVVRKRLMPFRLPSKARLPSDLDPSTLQIINQNTKVLGKVRGIENSRGIALTRIEEATAALQLKLGNHVIELGKPTWWPQEALKDLQSGKK